MDAAAAIEALETEVKDAFNRGYNAGYTAGIGYMSFKREKEQKRGEWIRVGDCTWKCSVCGEISCCDANYCPDCGAKMEVQDDSISMFADGEWWKEVQK